LTDYSGGGGAGGVLIDEPVLLSAGTYTIVIGGGGVGGMGAATNGAAGENGQDTVLKQGDTALATAYGGGGGGGSGATTRDHLSGKAGGSGGGGGNGTGALFGYAGDKINTQQGNVGSPAWSGDGDIGAGGGGARESGGHLPLEGGAPGGRGGRGIPLTLLSALLDVSQSTLYAAGGNGGAVSENAAVDGQNYGDGGNGPTNTETVSPRQGKAGHQGILYVKIPYTPPTALEE
jgi:hypothetical protein